MNADNSDPMTASNPVTSPSSTPVVPPVLLPAPPHVAQEMAKGYVMWRVAFPPEKALAKAREDWASGCYADLFAMNLENRKEAPPAFNGPTLPGWNKSGMTGRSPGPARW